MTRRDALIHALDTDIKANEAAASVFLPGMHVQNTAVPSYVAVVAHTFETRDGWRVQFADGTVDRPRNWQPMTHRSQLTINGIRCAITLARYPNGQLAMRLTAAETDEACDIYVGSPMGMPSYHDERIVLAPNEMLCKDYSEYEGYPDLLVAAGIAERTRFSSPRYGIPVLKLLIDVPPVER